MARTEEQRQAHAINERNRRQRLGAGYAQIERVRAATPKRREWKREYYATHKAYFAQKQREYRARHPDKANARWAKWYAENPEKVKLKCLINDQRRLARKAQVPSTLTRDQWRAIKAAYDSRCAYCGVSSDRLSQDHVTALSNGGGYTADNIVPACKSCNSRKGNRPPPTIPAKRLLL